MKRRLPGFGSTPDPPRSGGDRTWAVALPTYTTCSRNARSTCLYSNLPLLSACSLQRNCCPCSWAENTIYNFILVAMETHARENAYDTHMQLNPINLNGNG